ncbi:hypothetical protein [Allorhizocola rhizosphaerae]|uniref:hypothetical protein n=1 Tax=Allorhizocola rhizosphaerae TaxID=1872709 RepID=UPI000E3B9767|nr:hypothetical protein [Allorhizocola rhizosphaerae]
MLAVAVNFVARQPRMAPHGDAPDRLAHAASLTDVNAIVASVITAVITTLVVEYAAKPRLEVRKDRILRRRRAHEALGAKNIDLAIWAQYVMLELPKELTGETRENVLADKRRAYERMRTIIEELSDDIGMHASYHPPARGLMVEYLAHLRGVTLASVSWTRKAEAIYKVAEPMAWLLTPPPVWQVWKLHGVARAAVRVRQAIKDHRWEPAESADATAVGRLGEPGNAIDGPVLEAR